MNFIERSEQAERDLQALWVYIAENSSIETANRFLSTLEAKFGDLAAMPTAGRRRDDLGPELRSLSFQKRIIVYRIMDGGIRILRVVHGAQQIEDLFPAPYTSSEE